VRGRRLSDHRSQRLYLKLGQWLPGGCRRAADACRLDQTVDVIVDVCHLVTTAEERRPERHPRHEPDQIGRPRQPARLDVVESAYEPVDVVAGVAFGEPGGAETRVGHDDPPLCCQMPARHCGRDGSAVQRFDVAVPPNGTWPLALGSRGIRGI
jgi:hypothetical protein